MSKIDAPKIPISLPMEESMKCENCEKLQLKINTLAFDLATAQTLASTRLQETNEIKANLQEFLTLVNEIVPKEFLYKLKDALARSGGTNEK